MDITEENYVAGLQAKMKKHLNFLLNTTDGL